METFANPNTGNLALVNPLQTRGTVAPVLPENLGPRVLELASVLQTTLDIEVQINLFGKEIQRYLAVDGLHYTLPDSDDGYVYGQDASERATYSLVLHETSLGSIRVCREMPYTQNELASLENLLCALIYPLRNALSYKQAVELASRDPLTGIQNRMALNHALSRELDLAKRQSQPLSALVIDIDHFKAFNDKFGHSFGDDVLVTVAQTIANTVRRCDLLYRFGGEEFVVIASHTDTDGAQLLAERIRQNIAALKTVRGRSSSIRVSVGVTTLVADDTEESFFDRADKALYQAKNDGRNRTVVG